MRRYWECDHCQWVYPEDQCVMVNDAMVLCDNCFDDHVKAIEEEYNPDPPRMAVGSGYSMD